MDRTKEFHSVFEKVWRQGFCQDCKSKRIRTEADMVASIYHHLRTSGLFDKRKKNGLKLTVEKRLKGRKQYWIDLIVREGQEWLIVLECKLHISTHRKHDIEKVVKDLRSLQAARIEKPERAYLCYLLKAEGKPVEQLDSHLDSFEHKLSGELKWKPAAGYLWVARGIRVSKDDEERGKADWTGLDRTWQVLPWGEQEGRSRL